MASSRSLIKTIAIRTALVLAVAYIILNLGIAIRKNYAINASIRALQADIASLQARITILKAKLVYLHSSSYRELEAKRRLGLKKAGEQLVLVPANKGDQPSALGEGPALTIDQAGTAPGSVFDRASLNAKTWALWFIHRE